MTVREQAERLLASGWDVDPVFLTIHSPLPEKCIDLLAYQFPAVYGVHDIAHVLDIYGRNAVSLETLISLSTKVEFKTDLVYLATGTQIKYVKYTAQRYPLGYIKTGKELLQGIVLTTIPAVHMTAHKRSLHTVHAYGPFGLNTAILMS